MMNLKRAIGGAVAALAAAMFVPAAANAAKLSGAHMGHPGVQMAPPHMGPAPHTVHPNFSNKGNFAIRHAPGPNVYMSQHHRHHRHFNGFGYGFYAYPAYSYYADDSCYWLKVRAMRTGSRYWWNRYYECLDE
jgi:hypothetical protein